MKTKMAIFGFCIACLLAAAAASGQSAKPLAGKSPTTAEILAAAKPEDWRVLDPENTLYLELASGRVIIELSPDFAPLHVGQCQGAGARTLL